MNSYFQKLLWKGIILLSLACSQAVPESDASPIPGAESNSERNLSRILEKPLITGASVSADSNSLSPAKKLALQYTSASQIKTLAFGGRPGAQTIESLSNTVLSDRTSILALDFFFWDSTLTSAEKSLKALRELKFKAAQLKIPLVLGDIPELLPGNQSNRNKLNEAIRAQCTRQQNCFIMPFDDLHRQVLKDGYFLANGEKLSMNQIVPDGLHLSEKAGNELASRLKQVLIQ